MGKTFFKDLDKGSKAELFVMEQLRDKHPSIFKVEGKCIDYDLADREGYTVEVKYDTRSKKTNNLAFEFRHRGLTAGVTVSKAKDWALVYYLKGVGWVWTLVATKELRAFLINGWDYFRKYTDPTDQDKSELILVNTEDFANQFNYYKILDKRQGKV